MAIQGVGPNNVPAPHIGTAATPDALKTPAQKIADQQAEANAGINDGDEKQGVTSIINKLA